MNPGPAPTPAALLPWPQHAAGRAQGAQPGRSRCGSGPAGGRGGAAAVGAVGRGGSFESEDEEDAEDEEEREGKKRLIRTVPSVDWFDVEGNEVSVGQQVEDTEVRGLARAIIPLSRLGRGTGVCFCCVIEIDLLRGQDDTDKVLIA